MAMALFKLKSSNNQLFVIEETALKQCATIKRMIEDGCADEEIPLQNVDSETLVKVLEWCKKHAREGDDKGEEVPMKDWERKFVESLNTDELYDLIMAANYLEIKELLDRLCQQVADIIKGKTPEQIREIFNIENDFSAEEEKNIREENSWAFT